MKRRKLKPFVVPMLYTIAITFFVFSMYYLQKAVSTSAFKSNDIEKVETKYVDDESEKYALRIWLTRLGMNGPEFKTTRKILMKNLSGYAAFPNEEAARKFYAKQEAKRKAGQAVDA